MRKYKVLLFYKYTEIKNPILLRDWLFENLQELGIKGRFIVSEEGINATCAGLTKNVNKFLKLMKKDSRFDDIDWKVSYSQKQIFPKLSVKYRPEIVTLGLKTKEGDVDFSKKAEYIKPEELLKMYEEGQDFVIVDARNDYEYKVGKFRSAVTLGIKNFRDLPQKAVEKLQKYKTKKIVIYCTGGIRCEKASAFLRQQGFENVRQLYGGIHKYGEKTGGKYFEGEMFVFDNRLLEPVNKVNPKIISRCVWCKKKVSRYIDCADDACHKRLFICCEVCETKHDGFCSDECKKRKVLEN